MPVQLLSHSKFGKKPEVEVKEYRSLLSEDAIPNLQRILASIANTLLSMRYIARILV